jgi:hypothetical protein
MQFKRGEKLRAERPDALWSTIRDYQTSIIRECGIDQQHSVRLFCGQLSGADQIAETPRKIDEDESWCFVE